MFGVAALYTKNRGPESTEPLLSIANDGEITDDNPNGVEITHDNPTSRLLTADGADQRTTFLPPTMKTPC